MDENPSQSLNRSELIQFHIWRGEAAARLGDGRRELADLRVAEGLSRDGPERVPDNFLFLLGRAERASGSVKDAIRYPAERIGYAENERRRASRMLDTAFLEVIYGDINGAVARLGDARNLLVRALGNDPSKWSIRSPSDAVKFNKVSADIMLASGRYQEAADLYTAALAELEAGRTSLPGPFVRITRSQHALALLQLGRIAEAEIGIRNNLLNALFELGRNDPWTAFALGQLGTVVATQGRVGEAEKLFRTALEIFEAVGVVASARPLNDTRVLLAGTLVRQRRWDEASDIFGAVERDVAQDDPAYFERRFANNLDWALALWRTGRAAEAEAMVRQAAMRSEAAVGAKHYDTAEALGMLGLMRVDAGNPVRR